MTTDQILNEAAKTFKERNAIYKDNYLEIGPVMAGFFPKGITLKTPEEFIRYHLFLLMMVKLTRYTNNWETGHQDSLRDTVVYAAMLEQFDGLPKDEPERSEGYMEPCDCESFRVKRHK